MSQLICPNWPCLKPTLLLPREWIVQYFGFNQNRSLQLIFLLLNQHRPFSKYSSFQLPQIQLIFFSTILLVKRNNSLNRCMTNIPFPFSPTPRITSSLLVETWTPGSTKVHISFSPVICYLCQWSSLHPETQNPKLFN